MKKFNFISKAIILFLFASLLVFSTSFKKENLLNERIYEINLRNLGKGQTTFQLVTTIIFGICFTTSEIIIIYELCSLCCFYDSTDGEEQPNKYTFLYFCLNGLILGFIAYYFICKDTIGLYVLFAFLGISVICSIIYLVKSCKNPKKYCNNICTAQYLKVLFLYPCPSFCICATSCCDPENFGCGCICMPILAIFYIIGTIIEYYSFLLIYIFAMLITNIFTCSFCSDCDCNCSEYCYNCCHCSECCSKKNKQNTQINNQNNNDVIATVRAEVFIETNMVINESEISKNTNEDNDEREKENDYSSDNETISQDYYAQY